MLFLGHVTTTTDMASPHPTRAELKVQPKASLTKGTPIGWSSLDLHGYARDCTPRSALGDGQLKQ